MSISFLREALKEAKSRNLRYVISPVGENSKLGELFKSQGFEIIALDVRFIGYRDYVSALRDTLWSLVEAMGCR
jgi:hypothetical protein